MAKYVVTGAYVTVKTMTHQGPRILGLHSGAPWPADAEPAATQHHLDSKLIELVPEPVAVAVPEPVPVPAPKVEQPKAEPELKAAPARPGTPKSAGR